MTSDMTEKYTFKSDTAKMLEHNKVYLVFLRSLIMCLSNALVTSIMRQVNSTDLKAFEPPLKITLMLLKIPVEISKQYGSK